MRLHSDMRVQVIERAICLLTTLPTTLVHSFDFFISTAGALVLLGTGNGNEGIDLVEGVRYMTKRWRKQGERGGHAAKSPPDSTYLSWTASCSDIRRCIWDTGCGRLIWPWHVTWMSVLTPAVGSWLVHSWRWVALVLCHVVGLRVVRRIGRRVGRALLLLLSDRWIYRNVRVRLHVV